MPSGYNWALFKIYTNVESEESFPESIAEQVLCVFEHFLDHFGPTDIAIMREGDKLVY